MSASPPSSPLSVAIVGAGPRSATYARYALQQPGKLRVVAVAEPDPVRRDALAHA